MDKIKNIKNRLSLSVDKLSSATALGRSPSHEFPGGGFPASVESTPKAQEISEPQSPAEEDQSDNTLSGSYPKKVEQRADGNRTSEAKEDFLPRPPIPISASFEKSKLGTVSKPEGALDQSFDSFSDFSKALAQNEPDSLMDEVMKEVEKISNNTGNTIQKQQLSKVSNNLEQGTKLPKTVSGASISYPATQNEDSLVSESITKNLTEEAATTSSSTSLTLEKTQSYSHSSHLATESSFTTLSATSTLHAESLTSGYFSDSASEDAVNSDSRDRQARAKTASPIHKMFRISRQEKFQREEDKKTLSTVTKDESSDKKEAHKKESIYSRLIKSTKRDASTNRSSKEPIYARIKPKLKAETSFKPIEPVVSKEGPKESDVLVKPEPIYSKIKSKSPTSPVQLEQENSSFSQALLPGNPCSSFKPITTGPSDEELSKEPSKEPIYSSIKPKREKIRTLPLESLYSKIKKKDSNTFPKENVPIPKTREPIYNQPLPALPFENQNNLKKYEFLSSSGSESSYGKVVAVRAKKLSTISPSKPSVITINNPGYAQTFSGPVSSAPKTSPPVATVSTVSTVVHSTTEPTPTTEKVEEKEIEIHLESPVEEVKSDMEESIISISPSSKENLDMSRSSLGPEEDIKMDLGSTSKLSKLVEELAQELESVSQRTGGMSSADSKREVLNKLLSNYDVPKNLRRVEEADEDEVRNAEKTLLYSSSPDGLRTMDDDENMETVYADVPDYSQDEFVIALDDENDPKYASLTRGIMRKHRGGESPGKVSRKSAQVYVNVVNVISALKVLINSNSTKAATVINKMGTLARPYAQKVHTSISDNSTWIQRKLQHRSRSAHYEKWCRPTSAGVLHEIVLLHKPGHNGFDELRKYIKSGGEFCKELAIIMHERAELEASYAKGLHKLSTKLVKASRDSIGTISEAWQAVGAELEHEGDVHRILAASLTEDVVRPLRQVIETQHKIRKGVEGMVDKATKNLHDWKAAELKAKKNCYHNTRENEKVQDMMIEARLGRGKIHSDKEMIKLEKQRRKAEEAVQKSDIEYYNYCVRTERARQEWESAVYKGSNCFQTLEEDRLAALKDLILKYHGTNKEAAPKLVAAAARLDEPVSQCDVEKDIQSVIIAKGTGENVPEQFLPDFYSEDLNNVMNKARRREALEKFVKLIRGDLERERKGKQGVENLAKALQETPNFGGEDSQQDVNDKLQNMKAMLAYLEAARFKIQASLDELNSRPRPSHPLAKYIEMHRDKQGLPVSILKVPPWIKGNSTDVSPQSDSPTSGSPNWNDRGTADGNSVQPDSDFDQTIAPSNNVPSVVPPSSVEPSRDVVVAPSAAVPRAFMYPARYPSLILPTDEFSSQGSDPDYQNSVNELGPHQALSTQGTESPNMITTTPDLGSGSAAVDGTYYARPLPPSSGSPMGRCKALYDYEANLYDELTIRTGDIINIHEKQPDGWWVGEVEGTVGIFPATYVEEID